MLSGSCLCDGLITRPEESYRLWCVVVCDRETSRMRRPWPSLGRSATGVGGGDKRVNRRAELFRSKDHFPWPEYRSADKTLEFQL